MIYQDLDMKVALMRELKSHFLEGIAKIENTTVHGFTDEGSAPHIISVGVAGIRSEVLLHALEDKGIYVFRIGMFVESSGSPAECLKAIGRPESIWTPRCGSACRSSRRKKKLTTRWKHYIIVYRCFGNIRDTDSL